MKITENVLRKIVRSEIRKSLVKESYPRGSAGAGEGYCLYFRGTNASFKDLVESYGLETEMIGGSSFRAFIPFGFGTDVDPYILGWAFQIDKVEKRQGGGWRVTQIDADDLMRELH